MRFLLGALIGVLAGVGGQHLYQHLRARPADACLDRCGEGTRCHDGRCLGEAPRTARRERPRLRRGSRPAARGGEGEGETGRPPTAAELAVRSEGPTLQGTDYVNAAEAGEERELGTAEIDARVRAVDARVVGCIDRARGPIDFRQGQVVLAFRIERSGRVEKVRVSAPAGLQRAGLYVCLRALVVGLSFPPSGRAAVMRYPYSLH